MKLLILSLLSLMTFSSWAQELIHNESTITVQAGAVLYVEGTMLNTGTGIVNNSGTIELKGDLTNQPSSVWNSIGTSSIVKFSGGANSTVTSNAANFYDVVIQKDAGFTVNLADHMNISHQLNFNSNTSGRLVTGNFDVKLNTAAASIIGDDSDEYVATTGVSATGGAILKTFSGGTTFVFPVGDATNYTPLNSTFTSSTAGTIRTRANNVVHPNKPADATDYIARSWDVDAVGMTGYTNTMTGTYVAGDVTGTASLIKGASYNGGTWFYNGASNGVSTVIGTTTAATNDFTGTNFFGKALLKVYLAGAYTGGAPPMTNTLNTGGVIPLMSPYSVGSTYTPQIWNAPNVTALSIPATAVDWILVETRDAVTPATIISQTSAFLLNTGDIVNPDGSPLTLKNAVPSAIVSIRHRNHLGIRTAAAEDLVNPTARDFSTVAGQALAYRDPAIYPAFNDNMRSIAGVYTLWGGNAGVTGGAPPGSAALRINYSGSGNDHSALLTALSNNIANCLGCSSPVYHQADFNLNGRVNYSTSGNDRAQLLGNLNNNIANTFLQHL